MGGSKKSFKKLTKSASNLASKAAKSITSNPIKSAVAAINPAGAAAVGGTMAGEKVGPKIQQAIAGVAPKGTIVGDALDMATRTVSGGAVSLEGNGFLEQGNPLAGNILPEAVGSAIPGVGPVIEAGLDKKKAAEVAAEEAIDASKEAQDKLRREAEERERQEKALKDAASSRSRRRGIQLRRSRGEGRSGTVVGGKGKFLGSIASGDSLLGA